MSPVILVSGAVANKVWNGGAAWTRLSWALGMRQLGFDVFFVEEIGPDACVDASGNVVSFEHSDNLQYFARIVEDFGLAGRATLIAEGGRRVAGLSMPEVLDAADAAVLLINISGHLTFEPVMRRVKRKVYVDLDPGFTQFWEAGGNAGGPAGRT